MKNKFVFVCQQCGQTYSKWMGRCQECGQWNSVVEERDERGKAKAGIAGGSSAALASAAERPLPVSELRATSVLERDLLVGSRASRLRAEHRGTHGDRERPLRIWDADAFLP